MIFDSPDWWIGGIPLTSHEDAAQHPEQDSPHNRSIWSQMSVVLRLKTLIQKSYMIVLYTLKYILLLLLSCLGHVRLCVTPWMTAQQTPLSLGFSRQEHWSGLPFPSVHESEK